MPTTKTGIVCAYLYLVAGAISSCVSASPTDSPFPLGELRRIYGADETAVQTVADSYSLSLDDIAAFGPEPFPFNYILHQLNWKLASPNNPIVRRSEIEDLISGHSARCQTGNTHIYYLFYGGPEKLVRASEPTIFGKPGPLVVEVNYSHNPTLQDAQIVDYITYVELGDDGNPDWTKVVESCVSTGEK